MFTSVKKNSLYLTLLMITQVAEITIILFLIIMLDFMYFDTKAVKVITNFKNGYTIQEVIAANKKQLAISEYILDGELELSTAIRMDEARRLEEMKRAVAREKQEVEDEVSKNYSNTGFKEVDNSKKELTTVIIKENEVEDRKISEKQLLEELFNNSDVIFEGNIGSDVKLKACQVWSSVPSRIRSDYINNGWKIIVTENNLEEKYNIPYKVVGCTVQTEKTIYLINNSMVIDKALLHEMGHYVDWRSDYRSSSVEFSNIYILEKDNLQEVNKTDDYAQSSTEEYFAESFQQIIKRPDVVSVTTPNTYNFIAKVINSVFSD